MRGGARQTTQAVMHPNGARSRNPRQLHRRFTMKSFGQRRLPRLVTCVLACAAFMLTGSPAAAQTDTGRIAGVVRDPNGAVVSGATVVAKNERTGDGRTATTDAEGVYQVPALR